MAHRLLYHSTLGARVTKKKKKLGKWTTLEGQVDKSNKEEEKDG